MVGGYVLDYFLAGCTFRKTCLFAFLLRNYTLVPENEI